MAPGIPDIPVWKNAPFLRIVFPFMLGILMQWEFPLRFPVLISASGICLISYLYLDTRNVAVQFRFRKTGGILLHLLLLLTGMLCVRQHDIRNNKNWMGHGYRNSDRICIRIDEPPLERKNRYKISGTVTALVSEGQWKKVQGRVLVYLKRDSSCPPPACGEIWLIKKVLQPIRNSGNPGAFNYRQYAAFRDIHHRVMLDTSDRIVVGWQNPGRLNNFLYAARNHILLSLKKNLGDSGNSYGIAAALLIGYTEELDQEVLDSYSHTGVVHIIAVSGMHLGLIYLLLNRIFVLLPFLRTNRQLQSLLRIAGLWLFALLTGASASVCRAAVMFTLMDLGGLSGKSSAGLNALAASAFLLLLYHPFHLWDIGFQLSYLAVAGIMLFQQPLYRLIPLQNRMLDEVWKLSAVSVAAQLLTFPVCLLYFHQFPNLFLPANLLAVPLSALAIYAGIALVVFGNVRIAAEGLAWLVDTLIRLMNRWIEFIDRSPLSVWEQVPATVTTTVLLYAFIMAAGAGFLLRRKQMLMVAAGSLFLLTMAYRIEAWQRERRQCVWVFDIGGQRAVYFIRGNRYRYRGDAAPLQHEDMNRFHLKPAHAELVLSDSLAPLYRPADSLPLYVFSGKKILFIENSWKFNLPHKKLAVDLVVLSRNARMSIRKIDSAFAAAQYVADASNGLWKTEQWENECEELHLPCHIVHKKGAFLWNTD
jgi:competence protein ComEC